MKEIIENIGTFVLKKMDLWSVYLMRRAGLLKEDGWYRSFREEASVDIDGNPLPWITYPAIEFLKRRITPEMSVFEYGSGGSTLWWAARVNEVISVEHDKEWYKKMAPIVPDNVNINHIELEYGGAYAGKVKGYVNKFDIVVIDGRDRVNCAINSLTALKKTGVIVWDNSDREEYDKGYQFLIDHGFKKIEFIGLAPICIFKAETSVFYRPDNCLGI